MKCPCCAEEGGHKRWCSVPTFKGSGKIRKSQEARLPAAIQKWMLDPMKKVVRLGERKSKKEKK